MGASLALTAFAAAPSPGHGNGGGSMLIVLVLIGVVAGAYLLTHFVVDRLRQRFLFVSGIEYVVLGILLGPTVLEQVNPFADLAALGPVFAFAAAWVGLLYGMEFHLESLLSIHDRHIRLAVLDAVTSGVTIAVVGHAFFTSGLAMPPVPEAEAWMSAGVLGCAAAAGSSSAVDLLLRRYNQLETQLLPLLRRAARFGDLLAIVAFGLLFCIFHEGTTRTASPPAISDWILLTVGIGLALGVVFVLFLGADSSENNRFLAMVGILLFASGAAFFLNLSALLINLLLGVVLVNTRQGKGVFQTLERTAKPTSLVLLLFAGALWRPVDPLLGAAVALGYIGLRVAGLAVGTWIATLGTPLRGDVFRGLLAQGDVAVAMALSFRLVYEGPSVDLAYTAILVSVVIHELVAPRLLRGLLVDAGEVRQDLGPGTATGGL